MPEKTLPKVSILMATYNGARYLLEQLDSLRAQDYPHFDLIICDDASTDNTCELIEQYRKQYRGFADQISLIYNETNLGYIKNFERGLSYCDGEYLFFCDQDDIWQADKLSVIVKQAIKSNSLAVYSNAALIDTEGKDLGIDLHQSFGADQLKVFDHTLFYLANFIPGCTLAVSRELLSVALPFREGVPHDVWLAYHASYAGRITSVDRCLVQYRQHGSNALGMPGSVRKRRIDLYLRSKWRKLNVRRQLQNHQQMLINTEKRLTAMSEFEIAAGRAASEELQLLVKWSDDRLQGKSLNQYLPFFRSDNAALQLLNNRDNYCENPQHRAKKIRNRGYRSYIVLVLLISPLLLLFLRIITELML